MIDRDVINEKIEKLREYLTLLKEYRKSSLKELKEDLKLQGAVRCYLQLSIECVIDIGEIIISGLRLPRPEEAREVIEILGKNKIIPVSFSKHFSSVAGFRNILVHEYAKVDINKLYEHLKNDLKDFNFYIKYIVKFIYRVKGSKIR
jgi:uncharacterized protein YutE (UPF0331/DUF86 family)